MPNTTFDTIKTRLRQAVDDILRGETRAARPARVTVVRTERSAKKGAAAPTITRVYRLLDELKTLVGDLDRVVAEARTFLPKKKRATRAPKARKGRAGARRRRAASKTTARPKATSRRRKRRGPRPTLRTEKTTIVTSMEPRRSGTA
jgi:hypothetical protein